MTERPLLFAYGTLRRPAGHPMAEQLVERAERIGSATWRGLLYDLGAFPAAVRHAGHFRVHGDLYRLPDTAFLHGLDAYEDLGADAVGAFVRERDRVQGADGTWHEAWIYRYVGAVPVSKRIPHGDWIRHRADPSGPTRPHEA